MYLFIRLGRCSERLDMWTCIYVHIYVLVHNAGEVSQFEPNAQYTVVLTCGSPRPD